MINEYGLKLKTDIHRVKVPSSRFRLKEWGSRGARAVADTDLRMSMPKKFNYGLFRHLIMNNN